MRRPMVLGGVLFSLLLLVLLQIHPLWWGEAQRLPEKTAYLEGNLYEKEYRMRAGKKVPVLYLKDVFYYDVMPHSGGDAGGSLPKKIPYKIMCYMEPEKSGTQLGSRILLRGKIKNFRPATNDGEFDSAQYYQILGIGISVQDCEIMAQCGEGSALKKRLYAIKEYAGDLLYSSLNEEEASVMGSLLLGESALLDRDTKLLYKRSGIIHILAISGLHISMLGMGAYKLLRKCGVPIAICSGISAILVGLFVLMTGLGPSSLRALIMFGMQMAAHFLDRTYDVPTGLSAAAILVLAMQPLYLYHSGFMLSFLSVASLVLLQPVFAEVFSEKLAPGMAVFIGTLPVHAWFYHEAAPYALLLNLLVIPCMPVLMIFGGLLLALGAVWMPAAVVPAGGIHLLLQFYRWASALSLKLPGHNWVIGKPAVLQMILYLTIVVIVSLAWECMPKLWSRMMVALGAVILVSGFHAGLEIKALDVGQGDCFLVTDHRGLNVLVDGGSSSKKSVGEYQIEPALKYNGVQCLDAVIISHLDSDHYNGILELIESSDEGGVAVGTVFVSEAAASNAEWIAARKRFYSSGASDSGGSDSGVSEAVEKMIELVELAAAHDISVEIMPQGNIYRNGKAELLCLYPPLGTGGGAAGDTNENSMVLFLRYGDFTALFTGDLEARGEGIVAGYCRKLLDGAPLTLLKVAHHGSKNSTSAAFLEALHPRIALISAGANNSYGHPHGETLSRLEKIGARIFRTDEYGEITVHVRGSRVKVEGYAE